MKPRKKTKLCLQCNGVNPISASHCAYCGALLSAEEPEKVIEEFHRPNAPAQDLFTPPAAPFSPASSKEPAPYHTSSSSHAFVQDRQPAVTEEGIEKPLYSVFDQPQVHQMGDLKDELLTSGRTAPALQNKSDKVSLFSSLSSKISLLFSKKTSVQREKIETAETSKQKAHLIAGLAAGSLAAGTSFVFLSVLTFVFSQDGRIVLSWSEQTAAWLLLVSIGMIVFGLKVGSKDEQ